MNKSVLTFLVLTSFNVMAETCMDLNGTFTFKKGTEIEGTQVIVQQDCSTIVVGFPNYGQKVFLDGAAHLTIPAMPTWGMLTIGEIDSDGSISVLTRTTDYRLPTDVSGIQCSFSLDAQKNIVRICRGVNHAFGIIWERTEIGVREL